MLQAQLGKEGAKKQQSVLGDRPFWAEYQVPVTGRLPGGRVGTIDPTLVYPFQPGADVAYKSSALGLHRIVLITDMDETPPAPLFQWIP